MILVRLFEEWEAGGSDQWCWKNLIQSRAMRQARNIREQLQDYMRQVDWKRLEEEVRDAKKNQFTAIKFKSKNTGSSVVV